VGITGANFLIAETGSVVVVSNEGNADLTASWPTSMSW
jgi:L-lactate dehydrogenase complex protein LldF